MGQTHPPSPRPRKARSRRGRRIWRWIGYVFLVCFLLGIGAVGYGAKYTFDVLKTMPPLKEVTLDATTRILDAKGREITSLHGIENREFVSLKDIPVPVQDAFIAVEDNRYWQHFGIDLYRLAGAAWNDIQYLYSKKGELQGASTITQQLARNLYLTQEQVLTRKIQEAFIAIHLERTYTKQEILEKYLNTIYFGDTAYGIGAAAQTFFGKHVRDLKVHEGAMLAGMVKNPARFDPYGDPAEAKARQEVVLDQMVRYGYMNQDERDKAAATKIVLPGIPKRKLDYTGAHFVDYVHNVLTNPTLARRYGLQPMEDDFLYRSGYRIYTSLDLDMQKVADEGVATIISEKNEHKRQELAMTPGKPDEWIQAAVVVLEPKTGHVKAMVGGRTHTQARELNRATDSPRHPGSTMKPLAAYLPALQYLGMGTGSMVDDAPYMYVPETNRMWPENFALPGQIPIYTGMKPLRYGVEESINAMAVQLLNQVGIDRSLKMVQDMGINTLVTSGPHSDRAMAMTLGGLTNGVTLLEMVSAYGVIANLGTRVEPVVITRIENRRGEVIFQAQPTRKEIVPDSVAYLMVDLMKGVIRRGTAYWYTQRFNDWPAAGKTGTTEDNTDAWFIGFTPDLVTGIWAGYDNKERKRTLPFTGAYEPVMLWNQIMRKLVTAPPKDWVAPRAVQQVRICGHSGLLYSPNCHPGEERVELFRTPYLPTRIDDIHVAAQVVNVAPPTAKEPIWKLWRDGCLGKPETQIFHKRPSYVPHPKDPTNPRWIPRDVNLAVPTEYCRQQVVAPPLLNGNPGTQPGDPQAPVPLFPELYIDPLLPPTPPIGSQPPAQPGPGQPPSQPSPAPAPGRSPAPSDPNRPPGSTGQTQPPAGPGAGPTPPAGNSTGPPVTVAPPPSTANPAVTAVPPGSASGGSAPEPAAPAAPVPSR